MRLLLLCAVLIGLLPTPPAAAHGGAHCVRPGHSAEAGTLPAGHGGHDVPAEDCQHCPPAHCALQPHCGQVGAALVVMAPAAVPAPPRTGADRTDLVLAWPSRSHAPPVPPPLSRLT